MKNKEQLVQAFKTLLHSWGGDTPAEAIWAANEMMAAITGVEENQLQFTLEEEPHFETEKEYEMMWNNFFNQLDKVIK